LFLYDVAQSIREGGLDIMQQARIDFKLNEV